MHHEFSCCKIKLPSQLLQYLKIGKSYVPIFRYTRLCDSYNSSSILQRRGGGETEVIAKIPIYNYCVRAKKMFILQTDCKRNGNRHEKQEDL